MIRCTTAQFWEAMEHPGFVRISLHEGANARNRYTCEVAPEEVPGFLERKVDSIFSFAQPEPYCWPWTRLIVWWKTRMLLRRL